MSSWSNFLWMIYLIQIVFLSLINNKDKREQQNLTSRGTMQTDKSERSLSPLGKDPLSVGKLFKPKRMEEQNPESTPYPQAQKSQQSPRQKSPKSIGINTSRTVLPTVPIITKYNINENQVRPITHMKMKEEQKEQKEAVVRAQPYNRNKFVEMNRSFQEVSIGEKRRQIGRAVNNEIPGVVDFPSSYLYDETQDQPETPDLPNRTKMAPVPFQKETPKESPVLKFKKSSDQKSEPGLIKHQNKSRVFSQSAPKDFGTKLPEAESFHISSPQLPYINKLENNINGFKKFMNEPSYVSSSTEISYNNFKNLSDVAGKYKNNASLNFNSPNLNARRKSVAKNVGEIVKKLERMDPEEEEKLEQRKSFRISTNNFQTNRTKLPTFREQNKQQYEQQVDLDRSHAQNKVSRAKPQPAQKSVLSNYSMVQEQSELNPGTLFTNSFIKNTAEGIRAQNILIIDLRTSMQKIKQALIQSDQQLSATFNIPESFYHPPSSVSSSQELHTQMLEVFSHIGINPQIVSIKKYINCVVMREKKLCLLWNFNGKVYFGGWKKEQTLAQGNKDGIGLEWVPSRYIYYGEFKDNKKEGYGIMKKANKEIYIGCWKNNQRWGWGKVYDPEGNLHQNGQFIEGCFIYPQKGYRDSSP